MKFTLTISTFNDGMRDGANVAAALRKAADRIENYGTEDLAEAPILDVNGNTVGRWHYAAS